MSRTVPIQLGLFGGASEIADMHVVSAHTRTLSDGSEVFVGEHIRWNRGRQVPRTPAPRAQRPVGVEDEDAPEAQLTLFGA